MKIRKHCGGVYRLTLSEERFGQVQRRVDDKWMAEIRHTQTGNLIRYAGIWDTRKQAVDELLSIPSLDL